MDGIGPVGTPAESLATVGGRLSVEAQLIANRLIAVRLLGDRVTLTVQALLVARSGRQAGEVVSCLARVIRRRTRTVQHRTLDLELPDFGLGAPLVRTATDYVNAMANGHVLTQRAIMEDWESADLPAPQRLYLMATVVFLTTAVAASLLPGRH